MHYFLSNVDKIGRCRKYLIDNALVFKARSCSGTSVSITLEKEKRVKRVLGAFVCITAVSPNPASPSPDVINTQIYLLEWIAMVRTSMCKVHIARIVSCLMFACLQLLCFNSQDFRTFKIVCDFASKNDVAKHECPTRQHFQDNLYLFGCKWKKRSGNFGIDFQGLDATHNIVAYHPDFDSPDKNTHSQDPNAPRKTRRIEVEDDAGEES